MLVLSWRQLDQFDDDDTAGFETEYYWENFILRLWLYRTTVKTFTKLTVVQHDAKIALKTFDAIFEANGHNGLKAIRDMIEHFDDYAAGVGRGPAERATELDPWRVFTRDHYERGQFRLERKISYDAAINLRSDAKILSNKFIEWFKSQEQKTINPAA